MRTTGAHTGFEPVLPPCGGVRGVSPRPAPVPSPAVGAVPCGQRGRSGICARAAAVRGGAGGRPPPEHQVLEGEVRPCLDDEEPKGRSRSARVASDGPVRIVSALPLSGPTTGRPLGPSSVLSTAVRANVCPPRSIVSLSPFALAALMAATRSATSAGVKVAAETEQVITIKVAATAASKAFPPHFTTPLESTPSFRWSR